MSVESITPALDAESRLIAHIPCSRCGYSLHMLNAQGMCPECGASIQTSLETSRLIFADARWLRNMRRGLLLLCIGLSAMILIDVCGYIAFRALGLGSNATLSVYVSVRMTVEFIVAAITIVGAWLVTSADVNRPWEHYITRVVARWFVIFGEGALAMNDALSLGVFQSLGNNLYIAWGLMHETLRLGGGIASMIGIFALFMLGQQIAMRMPNPRLARQCAIVKWGMAVPRLFNILIATAFVFFGSSMIQLTTSPSWWIISTLIYIPLVAFSVLTVGLLVKFRRHIELH